MEGKGAAPRHAIRDDNRYGNLNTYPVDLPKSAHFSNARGQPSQMSFGPLAFVLPFVRAVDVADYSGILEADP